MAIQTLYDTGSDYEVEAIYDGAVYQTITEDGVIADIGDEFDLSYSASSLEVSFSAGNQAIIDGAFFRTTSLTTVTLAANSTIYLTARIDKSLSNGSRGEFHQCTSSNMKSERLNDSGNQRDLLLYVVVTGASGVTSVTDMRNIVSGSSSSKFKVTKDTSGNTLATPIEIEIRAVV